MKHVSFLGAGSWGTANNGKPMKYVSTVRLNADQREHHFVDVDTGEERIVMDCT